MIPPVQATPQDPHGPRKRIELLKCGGVLLAGTGILIIDWQLPLGIATGMLYATLTGITLWIHHKHCPFFFSIVFSLFIFSAFLKPLPGDVNWSTVIANRGFSLVILWLGAIMIYKTKARSQYIMEQNILFEDLNFELEQQLATIEKAAIVGMLDRQLKFQEVNTEFLVLSGLKHDEIQGRTPGELGTSQVMGNFYHEIEVDLLSGKAWKGELCLQSKRPGSLWIQATIAPFFGSEGKVQKYMMIGFDITQQKEQHTQLEKQAQDLKQANEELETFSYSVSHDIRAPLRVLRGFSDALIENYGGTLDERGNRWLGFISDNANRMDILTRDILAFSRVSRGNLTKHPVEMNGLVSEVFSTEQAWYPGKNIDLEMGKLPPCLADYNMIRQVWQNLISNALKFSTRREDVKIQIRGEESHGYCIYAIADNGVGFDEIYSHKLFGVFQRLHTHEEFDGTGVGLAIVQRVIQKHGGWIHARSRPMIETEFTFGIPGTVNLNK